MRVLREGQRPQVARARRRWCAEAPVRGRYSQGEDGTGDTVQQRLAARSYHWCHAGAAGGLLAIFDPLLAYLDIRKHVYTRGTTRVPTRIVRRRRCATRARCWTSPGGEWARRGGRAESYIVWERPPDETDLLLEVVDPLPDGASSFSEGQVGQVGREGAAAWRRTTDRGGTRRQPTVTWPDQEGEQRWQVRCG